MGCPHRSHLVKTASIGPTPLSVSGALREYSLRLLSQFLMAVPRLLYRGDRFADPAQPLPRPLGPILADEPHQLAPYGDPVRLDRRLRRVLRGTYPEPQSHRRLRPLPHPPEQLDGLGREPLAHPCHPS